MSGRGTGMRLPVDERRDAAQQQDGTIVPGFGEFGLYMQEKIRKLREQGSAHQELEQKSQYVSLSP